MPAPRPTSAGAAERVPTPRRRRARALNPRAEKRSGARGKIKKQGRASRTPGSECLALLPSGSDAVRRPPLRGARPAAECSSGRMGAMSGFGVFSVAGEPPRVGFRNGDEIVDLAAAGLGAELRGAVAERAARLRARRLGRRARPDARARRARRGAARAARARDAPPAVRGRRLRRLLLLARARDERRAAVPARRGAAPPELAPAAGRLPRPGRHGRRQRHRCRAPARPGEGGGRRRARVRAHPPARRGARARVRGRRAEPRRRAGAAGGVRRPRLRRRARERLERPRLPGVGVGAARPVPRQVVPDLDRRVGDAARAARGPPRRGAAPGASRRSRIWPAAATGRSISTSSSS